MYKAFLQNTSCIGKRLGHVRWGGGGGGGVRSSSTLSRDPSLIVVCICCGLILYLVQNFSNQFDFCFSLSYIHYHNLKQREIQIKLV